MPRSRARSLAALVTPMLLLGAGLAPTPARADEPLFGFVYTTDLLPKGEFEVEQWLTWRRQKAHGSFNVWEHRTEFSYGATDDLQLSLYANYSQTEARQNAVDGTTTPAETFADHTVDDPDARMRSSHFIGISGEAVYRVLSPYVDPIGLAFYFEPTIGRKLREFEEKIIVQKNFFDDRLVIAGNLTIAQELRRLNGDPTADPSEPESASHWDKETDLNFSLGATYRFASNWSLGAEFINEREFNRLIFWNGNYATNSAFYLGPTLHYGGERFFFTLTLLQQMPWGEDYANAGVMKGGVNYADDFEKYRMRLKVGVLF
jgi:hypothetical protein